MGTLWPMERASDQNKHFAMWERSPFGWVNRLSWNDTISSTKITFNMVQTHIKTLYPKKSASPTTITFLITPLNMSMTARPRWVSLMVGNCHLQCWMPTDGFLNDAPQLNSNESQWLIDVPSHFTVSPRNGLHYSYCLFRWFCRRLTFLVLGRISR